MLALTPGLIAQSDDRTTARYVDTCPYCKRETGQEGVTGSKAGIKGNGNRNRDDKTNEPNVVTFAYPGCHEDSISFPHIPNVYRDGQEVERQECTKSSSSTQMFGSTFFCRPISQQLPTPGRRHRDL
ncbi:hypothetical protein KUCAC02_001113 [Chaenocephalus aceratus]|uniref:Uncharacterized protein n=1 Tax=Chaenocephalus aceratus TaxID=36190 RepID=A0ACB9XWP4_CHAAC|nr:hypothetical protein KUCAC02_001113 [Chaenocephalus aceratus]